MSKFIDANIFVRRFNDPSVKEFTNQLSREEHCTSVLVLAETYHKLEKFNLDAFSFLRTVMGAVDVLDVTQNDFFLAMTNKTAMNINDKIHIATMKRNGISTIISFDTDFDKDKTIKREEP